MSWLWSALMPHPPVLLPEIGRGREKEAVKTLQGIERITSAIRKPDFLFVLSPHQPYSSGALFVNSSDVYHGSFALFGVPHVKLSMISADISEICAYLEKSGIPLRMKAFNDLTRDQGSMVPLYFMKRAWGDLPPVIISSPIGLEPHQAFAMGQFLAQYHSRKNFALLASGDLSHRLAPDAPAGYEPEFAPIFESAVDEALKTSSPDPLFSLDEFVIERAGECGLRSLMAMLGLVSCMQDSSIEIFSHEWPFGVGYCNALWRNHE